MGEARFISDKAQGYDVLDIANKSAALMERAQNTRMRKEQAQREQQQYEQQQKDREFMRPAMEAKRDADLASANAAMEGFKQEQQYRKDYKERGDILRTEFFEGTRGKSFEDQDAFLDDFRARTSYLDNVPEAKGFVQHIAGYQKKVRAEMLLDREFQEKINLNQQEIEGRQSVAKIGYEKATESARITADSREQIASEHNALKQQMHKRKEGHAQFRNTMAGIDLDRKILNDKKKSMDMSQDDYQKYTQELYDRKDAALDQYLKSTDDAVPESQWKIGDTAVDAQGNKATWNGSGWDEVK